MSYPIKKITIDDPLFPAALKTLHDPPPQIYFRGNSTLFATTGVALVGTRRTSYYGRNITRKYAATFAHAGLTVISGLAFGIDTAAHLGALDVHGFTIAVLGSGVDDPSLYPRTNEPIAQRILKANGLIISENEPGTTPQNFHFVKRNRIIAALARATIVTEAPEKSGALTTARYALELGRDVYAIPADINRVSAIGSNRLIHSGATPLLDPTELIDTLIETVRKRPRIDAIAIASHNPREALVLDALRNGATDVDSVIAATNLPPHQAITALSSLELAGLVAANGADRILLQP